MTQRTEKSASDVAVVMPVRNMETTVKRAAESILQQTYRRGVRGPLRF